MSTMLQLQLTFEEWRDIPGYEGIYQISDMGRVKRIKAGQGAIANKILKGRPINGGYLTVDLRRDATPKTFLVHRLVAIAFLGDITNLEVNHLNGIPTDNRLINLEIVTRSENLKHAFGVLKRWHGRGNAKLNLIQVREIRRLFREGIPKTELCRQFAISVSTIDRVIYGYSWTNDDLANAKEEA